MKVTVSLDDYTVDKLYEEYTEQGGKLSKEDLAEVCAEHILGRYFSTEYFDLLELKQTVD